MANVDDLKLPKIGNKAPLFSLFNQDEEKISLKDFYNQKTVVLYFYPKAMTPGCTVQAKGIRDFKKQFAAKDVVVFGLSPDPVKSLVKFQEKQNLNFDLLSDMDHAVAEKYGVWGLKKFMGREYMGVNRITFIIGKDGKLKHIIEKVKTKTHHEDVFNWISQN
ncbi:MAG: thioredoxin-dependent thiol peroxidase [Bdellovibrionaceae bacterium]|nr:thioredoxin-dependent thiol peroxidase [Pseudobdellovibrionaceae bacterium]